MNEPPLIRQFAPPPPPPRRTGWVVYSVLVTCLLLFSVLANLVLLVIALGMGATDGGFGPRPLKFHEDYVSGEFASRNKIAVIHVSGVISSMADGAPVEDGLVGLIDGQLQQALHDPNVKAIIIRINSPGGEVVASDMIYRAIHLANEKKPVVACIDSVGASGGYYVAVGARHIVATEMSITGSIGVIMQTLQFTGLMEKIGVKAHTFVSGKFKDLLNPTREPTEPEKQLIQDLIMHVYDKFVGIVAHERKLDLQKLKDGLADGRILSGEQAKEAGLIDEVGYFDDAVGAAKDFAGIKEARVVRYLLPFSFRNLFRILGENDRAKIQLDLDPRSLHLESGKLYLLPAYLFQ